MKIIDDLKAFSDRSNTKKIVVILTNPCFHCVVLFRISSFLNRIKLTPLAKIMWYLNRIIFGIDIDYRADLAGGFVIVHGLGVVIGKNVVSEGKLIVYQNCTIGGDRGKSITHNGKKITQPYFENNVKICPGAMLFGPIVIERDTIIKAGSLISLNKDNSKYFATYE